jgi:hypothetical protein
MRSLISGVCFLTLSVLSLSAAELSGTWKFSVDLESHEHGDPTFVLQQKDGKLTGTYNGPFGEQAVSGMVDGDTAHFEVAASGQGGSVKLTYQARIEDQNKMSGTMTRNVNGESTPGKWTAKKSK